MKTNRDSLAKLLSFARLGDGARASARFNVASHAARKTPGPLAVGTLKRRERRAPLTPASCHSMLRLSMVCGLVFVCGVAAHAALPSAWQHTQQFDVAAPGLIKISLPVETLDAARPAFEDLRLYDDAGNEQSYWIERAAPVGAAISQARSFRVSLNTSQTVITVETGLSNPVDGVSLETPASDFIKAVQVEGSIDGQHWQLLAQGLPVFRQNNGAAQLDLPIKPATWSWLRLTVDDQRSAPVPFTGAMVSTLMEPAPSEALPAAITERQENPGESRLTLNLSAANLTLAALELETAEPLFTRQVTVVTPEISGDSIGERSVSMNSVFRVAVEGQPVVEKLQIPIEGQIKSRELSLLIKNGDSPPLPVSAVRVERRPVCLVFMARSAGTFRLLTGNKSCAAPHYDLASLGADLKNTAVTPVKISAPVDNPDYHAPEALAGLEVAGAALDVSAWKFRKPVQLARGGAQQFELDLDTLAHADAGFADLRLLHGSNQVPYIIQRTSISRALTPVVIATNDAKNLKLSRWLIQLPKSDLPITRLTCVAKTPLFQRSLSLSEELTDERGDRYRQPLGSATWTQTPERKTQEFSLPLDGTAQSDTLILETENGDNPPIELENFTIFYPATRVLFKTQANDRTFLYYGHPSISPPSYDLSLVAGELLAADKSVATLAAEEQLKKTSWAESPAPGTGGILFWGILAVVVIGLLVVISRLLPKAPAA
jgi:hypothetical protein